MDFSEAFAALRDRMEQTTDPAFTLRRNAEVCGRVTALQSEYSLKSNRKMFGLVPTGLTSHAHEYRLLFAAPKLDAAAFEQWWQYACLLQSTLVQPDDTHEFSLVSLILATEHLDKALRREIKRKASEVNYAAPQRGWSSVRLAVCDLTSGEVLSNRYGTSLLPMLHEIMKKNA